MMGLVLNYIHILILGYWSSSRTRSIPLTPEQNFWLPIIIVSGFVILVIFLFLNDNLDFFIKNQLQKKARENLNSQTRLTEELLVLFVEKFFPKIQSAWMMKDYSEVLENVDPRFISKEEIKINQMFDADTWNLTDEIEIQKIMLVGFDPKHGMIDFLVKGRMTDEVVFRDIYPKNIRLKKFSQILEFVVKDDKLVLYNIVRNASLNNLNELKKKFN